MHFCILVPECQKGVDSRYGYLELHNKKYVLCWDRFMVKHHLTNFTYQIHLFCILVCFPQLRRVSLWFKQSLQNESNQNKQITNQKKGTQTKQTKQKTKWNFIKSIIIYLEIFCIHKRMRFFLKGIKTELVRALINISNNEIIV